MSRIAITVAAAVLVAGCTSGDDDGQPVTSVLDSISGSAATSAAGSSTSVVDLPTTFPVAAPTSATSIPEPTGVAGVGSDDSTCSGMAQINGTFQLLAIAAAFGSGDPVGLARTEMVASSTVVAAADALFASWPDELEAERVAMQEDVIGPVERRAERAVQALRDAGATDEDLATLTDAWAQVLRNQERDNPDVVIPALPDRIDTILANVAESFAADVTVYSEDPSLLRGNASTPTTDAWLSARCPEVLAGSGSDAV